MNSDPRRAIIYRMVMPDHICPFGLLKREGFAVEDNWLKTREETDDFKTKHDVKTTPQTFIDGSGSVVMTTFAGILENLSAMRKQ